MKQAVVPESPVLLTDHELCAYLGGISARCVESMTRRGILRPLTLAGHPGATYRQVDIDLFLDAVPPVFPHQRLT